MTDDGTDDNQQEITDGEPLVKPLPQDGATPFSPPTDPIEDAAAELEIREQAGRLDPTHQRTDDASDIDSDQLYQEGLASAAEASEPNAGNSVVGYDPDRDQRRRDEAA